MSSHHFVREGQEPALLIDIPEPVLHPAFHQLLEWNPVVICTEIAVPAMLAAHVGFDFLIIKQEDHELWKDVMKHRPEIQIKTYRENIEAAFPEIINSFPCNHLQILALDENFERWQKLNNYSGVTLFDISFKWQLRNKGTYNIWCAAGTLVKTQAGSSVTMNEIPLESSKAFIVENDGLIKFSCNSECWIGLSY